MPAGACGAVGVESKHGKRRHGPLEQGGQTLGADAVASQGHRGALGAGVGEGLRVAAVMTAKPLIAPVEYQRDVALGTAPGVPAGPAGHEPRPAPPVQEHDRLGAHLANLDQRLGDARMDRRLGVTAGPRSATGVEAGVEHLDRRQLGAVDAMGQLKPAELQPALGPRGRGAGDQGGAGFLRPASRDRARVVARIGLLLVGGVVLLVDHDEAQVSNRREDRGARPDADQRLAGLQAVPFVAAFAGGQPRVKQRDPVPEAAGEPRDDLRGQPDLRHQHDRPLPAPKRRLGRGEVHLGLPGPGDPVEQELAGGRSVDRRHDRAPRIALLA